MIDFIRELVGNDLWATLVMSLFPLIELKGGIVFARGAGFDFLYALIFAYLGSTIVFFPIYFLLKPILSLIKKIKIISVLAFKVENYFNKKSQQALEKGENSKVGKSKNANFLKQLGVFIFVAIPLPMTGVWTGTAIAVFLNLKFKDAILPVVIGNLVAGLIISLLAEICIVLWTIFVLDYILYGLFAIALIFLVVLIIKVAVEELVD